MFFNNINRKLEKYRSTAGAVLVDVREPEEYRSGHIPGAVNVPLSQIERINIDRSKTLLLYCLRGTRSRRAAAILRRMGCSSVRSIGGIKAYKGVIER